MMMALSSPQRRVAINICNLIQAETIDILPQSSGFGEQCYFNKHEALLRWHDYGIFSIQFAYVDTFILQCTNDSDRTNH
jgi:hypothetical protein